jgi:hypothetical protein
MTSTRVFEPRTYRDFTDNGRFRAFRVKVETSDLYIKALGSLEKEAEALIKQARYEIRASIRRRPEFLTSLTPMGSVPDDSALVVRMIDAGKKAGIGPMSAVAGAVAEYVGRGLLTHSQELMVENGGDIFMRTHSDTVVGIYASESPFSGKIGLEVKGGPLPTAVCSSSATVGPSLSMGGADAAVIISRDTPLADAVATATGNMCRNERDLQDALNWACSIQGVQGALVIMGDKIGAKGDVKIV